MKIFISKPDALGDQLIVAGAIQTLRELRPSSRIVWHVRAGMEAIAPLIGAEVFTPALNHAPKAEAARLAEFSSPLVLLPFPLSAHEDWTDDLRGRVTWWAAFLRATTWDATALALVNRNWVGDFTVSIARAPVRIGFAATPARQPLVNEAQALAGTDVPDFTQTLAASFTRSEAAQLRDLLRLIEPRLPAGESAPRWGADMAWAARPAVSAQPRVFIAPGVGGDPRRAWGVTKFLAVAETLRGLGATIVWLEGPDDARYLKELPDTACASRLTFGPNDLGKLASTLGGGDLLLCQDTAYVHLAAGVGVPTVAIYGAGQHARFHPSTGRIKIVQSDIACAGCQWHCLFDRLVCVTDVPVERVADAALRMLAGDSAPAIVTLQTPLAAPGTDEPAAIRRRLQHEVLALNADRFARLQIVQNLLTPPAATRAAQSSMEPRLSVVIPMGRPERVASTLASLAAQGRAPSSWEIMLVGVEADAVARAHPRLPIQAVVLASNQLPPKTRCLGVERASGEWLLFIDDDVELAPDFYERFLALLETAPFAVDATDPIGAVGPRLPGKSGRFFETLTDISNFWAQQSPTAEDRGWLYSAAIFVRAEAYRRSGGFNPELPNGEDVDLTRRIVAAGYRLRYEPTLVARHDHRRDTLLSMWRYFWRNGNAARYFFAATAGASPFSVKTAWLKSRSDLRMNREFQRAHGRGLGARTPLVWLNYLIVEASLEWHWQEWLWQSKRYRELPARSAGDRSAVKAFAAFDEGRALRGIACYALAMLQNLADPVRR